MKISIIIPLYVYTDSFRADFSHFTDIDYPDYEIIIVHDNNISPDVASKNVVYISTNQSATGPAEKRDLAIQHAKGDICAFIDDDAYPDRNWLKRAAPHFEDSSVGAVGGPGLTPKEDSFLSRAGGCVYESFLGSGGLQDRFIQGVPKDVVDWPAYNLLIRTKVLVEVGGYNSTFYGGEDTKVCLAIIGAKYRIKYEPQSIVYHHRRPLFAPHLRQIANVGRHRGYFFKKFPATSKKLIYIAPSIFSIICVLAFIATLFNFFPTNLFLLGVALGLVIAFLNIHTATSYTMRLVAAIAIIATHLTYGFSFVKGFFTKELTR